MELVTDKQAGGVKRVVLNERLDLKNILDIQDDFTAFTATDASPVIIDLAGVDFIASIGMRMIISCAKANAALGGKFVLYGAQPLVREELETVGIDRLIPLFDDEKSALAAIQTE